MPQVKTELLVNGRVVARGTGEDVLGNPASAVAWLANKLAEFGVALEVGQVVVSGSMTRPVFLGASTPDAAPGEAAAITADFGSLGVVTMSFRDGPEKEADGSTPSMRRQSPAR
ncbi:hypothetical protein ACFWM5_36540 [Streptomyces bobili]|uniref:hypothetical protein n=1 Tax=Streptomyces bobili TaxID=67280 RepID=UPI003658D2B6